MVRARKPLHAKEARTGRAGERPLPLDDPRWVLLDEVLRQMVGRIGNESVATLDFGLALRAGSLRTMRRHVSDGQETTRELVPPESWAGDPPLSANYYHYPPDPQKIHGWIYYAWEPDLKELLEPRSEEEGDERRQPGNASKPLRRRGPPNTHEWHAICGEIARRCHDQSGRIAVPKNESRFASDMLLWCEGQYGCEPAESEMREAVKNICAALRKVPAR